jgi:hypothetical protein
MTTLDDLVAQAIAALEQSDVAALDDEQLQRLVVAVVRRYAARVLAGDHPPPPVPDDVEISGTEALLITSGLLRRADVSAFELAMMTDL